MNAWDIKREMAIPIWQERIKACRASGMSIDLWCAANNISRKTYYRWEKLCIARALQGKEGRIAETCNEHTFWVGPRSAKLPDRKPIIRWLAPIPIGMDWRRELPTNIHMVLEN